jgi:dienelactone hydrolase
MKTGILLLMLLGLFACNKAEQASEQNIKTAKINYDVNGQLHAGYVARPNDDQKHPGVIVVHEWWGHNEYVQKRARMLAEMGYVALALDMYGDGQQAKHPKDAQAFSARVMKDVPLAKKKFETALKTLKEHPNVNPERIGAIGYCFGGGIVLNMANLGVDLDAVVSFHGGLKLVPSDSEGDLETVIMVFNGAKDPMVSADDISNFKKAMKLRDAEFKLVNYPNAVHAFTNPGATELGKKFNLPLAYDEAADKDSWAQTEKFLREELLADFDENEDEEESIESEQDCEGEDCEEEQEMSASSFSSQVKVSEL